MNKLLQSLKDSAKMIAMIAFFTSAGLVLVSGIGDFGNSFMPVLGSFINTLIMAALLALVPVIMLMKKEEFIKPVSLIVVGYFFINLTSTYLSATGGIVSYNKAFYVVIDVLTFIAALGLITAFVFYLIALLGKKENFYKLAAYVLLCLCSFTTLVFLLEFIAIIIYGGALGIFYYLAILVSIPVAITFTVYPYLIGDIPEAPAKAAPAKKAEIAPAEEKKEEPAKAEETPATEAKSDETKE